MQWATGLFLLLGFVISCCVTASNTPKGFSVPCSVTPAVTTVLWAEPGHL